MKYSLIALFLLSFTSAFSQDYMEVITDDVCKCIEKTSDTLTGDAFNLELGLCMLDASEPYKKQLKKDHGIDFDKIDVDGEKLGRLIGMRLATACPNLLMKMVSQSEGLDMESAAPELEEFSVEGIAQKIETEQFVVITIKEVSGKSAKYYWMDFIASDLDLPNEYTALEGKNVTITYVERELFDARLKEYRKFNVIIALDAF